MDQQLLEALEKVLARWISTAEEPVMMTARATILRIAQKIAEGDYDKYETDGKD
jgi:hypothetical protein